MKVATLPKIVGRTLFCSMCSFVLLLLSNRPCNNAILIHLKKWIPCAFQKYFECTWWLICSIKRETRDDTRNMTSIKIVQFLRPPTPFVNLRPKFFYSLDLNVQFQTNAPLTPLPPPPPPEFQRKASLSVSAFSWLYTLVYAVVEKYNEMSFIYNYSLF